MTKINWPTEKKLVMNWWSSIVIDLFSVFLVRHSESIPNVFVLSFTHNQKVKHCTICKVSAAYTAVWLKACLPLLVSVLLSCLHVKQNHFRKISKLFLRSISRVTTAAGYVSNKTPKPTWNYFGRWRSSRIVSKLFRRQWTERVGKYSWAAESPWNDFRQVPTRWNRIISDGRRRRLKS